MAREIWIRAKVGGVDAAHGNIVPRASCGLHRTGDDLVWARPCMAADISDLACFARGIINSSNTALVSLPEGGYAPLGKADGPAETVFGMQLRKIRNEMSRDPEIDFFSPREHAEKYCLLMSGFRGVKGTFAEMLALNGIKPDRMDLRKLSHIFMAASALSMRNIGEMVEIPKNIL